MMKYHKLYDLMRSRGMKVSDLRGILSPPTLARIRKGENITTDTLSRICNYLDCQPGDIMEYVHSPEDK